MKTKIALTIPTGRPQVKKVIEVEPVFPAVIGIKILPPAIVYDVKKTGISQIVISGIVGISTDDAVENPGESIVCKYKIGS